MRLPVKVKPEFGNDLDHPTPTQLAAAIERLDQSECSWITVRFIPDQPYDFIQAATLKKDGFNVQWRGGAEMVEVDVDDRLTVLKLFSGWASRVPGWNDGLEWRHYETFDVEPGPVDPTARTRVEQHARKLIQEGYWSVRTIQQSMAELSREEDSKPINSIDAGRILAPLWMQAAEEQRSWAEKTDCDRIESAFAYLTANGIVAKSNFTCCTSCGSSEIWEYADESTRGYAFFHRQDLEQAATGATLMVGYGSKSGIVADRIAVAHNVIAALQDAGLSTKWNDDPRVKIEIEMADWRKRLG